MGVVDRLRQDGFCTVDNYCDSVGQIHNDIILCWCSGIHHVIVKGSYSCSTDINVDMSGIVDAIKASIPAPKPEKEVIEEFELIQEIIRGDTRYLLIEEKNYDFDRSKEFKRKRPSKSRNSKRDERRSGGEVQGEAERASCG